MDEEANAGAVSPRHLRWVRNSCLYRLNQKMMSEKQLFDALFRKARQKFADVDECVARQIAQAGIDFCNGNNFLNDANFAEVKAASGIRAGKSRRRIAMDLNQKGVQRELIETSLEAADDFQAAINFARKRAFGPYRKAEMDEKRRAKEFAAFARNGFSSSIAIRVLRMTLDELD